MIIVPGQKAGYIYICMYIYPVFLEKYSYIEYVCASRSPMDSKEALLHVYTEIQRFKFAFPKVHVIDRSLVSMIDCLGTLQRALGRVQMLWDKELLFK